MSSSSSSSMVTATNMNMNRGSIAGARPRCSAGRGTSASASSIINVVSTGSIAADNSNNNTNNNHRFRSDSISTIVTSNMNKNNNTGNNKKRQLHNITNANGVTTSQTTTSKANNSIKKMLSNIHPTDYVKAGFKANGVKELDFESIQIESVKRFIKPTKEMISAYSTDIVMAVRTNNVIKARELFLCDNNSSKFVYGCNACNRFGESILHIACRRGHIDMVKFLINEVGLRVDTIRDDYHRTPLHDAFWTPIASYNVIDFLLKQSYVIELLLLKDVRGYTPLDYARSEDRGKWLHFLWERKSILHPTTVPVTGTVSTTNTTTTTTVSTNTSASTTTTTTVAVDNNVDLDDADTDTDDDITVTSSSTSTSASSTTTTSDDDDDEEEEQHQELLPQLNFVVVDVNNNNNNNKRQRVCTATIG